MPVRCLALAVACLCPAGCGLGGGGEEPAVMVLFDSTLTTADQSLEARYREQFAEVLAFFCDGDTDRCDEGPGGELRLDIVTAKGRSGSNPQEHEFPKKTINTNPLEFQRDMEKALGNARESVDELLGHEPDEPGTAILDALEGAARFLDDAEGERFLVIFSDMIEESDRLRFTQKIATESGTVAILSERGTDAFIEQERANELLPDLDDVRIYIAGADVVDDSTFEGDTQQARLREDFWFEYLEQAGGEVEEYEAVLTEFP